MIVIKKYSNRRLYDTEASEYINLEDLYKMVQQDINFIVIDAKTKVDLTRLILAQILFEKENKESSMLSLSFLRQLIKFHNSNMQNILLQYLEVSINNFVKNEEIINNFTTKYVNELTSFNFLEEITKNNLKFFENTMNNFFKGNK